MSALRCSTTATVIYDLRLLLYPIKTGWEFINKQWKYTGNNQNDSHELRTKKALGKTFNSIWNFLEFTTESGNDYEENYLPTLDFETKVLGNGLIKYRYYMKPMSNNRVLQYGTALSKNCTFSSLRQDLIRRLLSINEIEGVATRVRAVNKFIQLLRNSNHTFVYIKSIVLQALTKFHHMQFRESLSPGERMYRPLHRARDFKSEERLLSKYLSHSTWYTELNIGDEFKDLWKRNVTRKGQWENGNFRRKRRGDKDFGPPDDEKKLTTTTLFVPSSPGGKLLSELEKEELRLENDEGISWKCKLVEKPGIPVALHLIKKFPKSDGCPLGPDCKICENQGVKCSQKGIVYSATCMACSEQECSNTESFTGAEDKIYSSRRRGIYIGESSRPLRSRVKEHMEAVDKFKRESFIISHWMLEHSLDSVAPTFKFKTIGVYKDAMSRQLSEAIQILDQGTCNRKSEFSNNELIRMESYRFTWEQEKQDATDLIMRSEYEKKLTDFIIAMSNI